MHSEWKKAKNTRRNLSVVQDTNAAEKGKNELLESTIRPLEKCDLISLLVPA